MIRHSFVKTGTLLSFLILAAAAPATAEVVVVNQGTFVFGEGADRVDISGTRDFRFEGNALTGRFAADEMCFGGVECGPGAVIPLDAAWIGNDLPGTAELRGTLYPDVGGHNSPNYAHIEFTGQVTMPDAMTAEPISITVPFDFAGRFVYGPDLETPSQTAALTGGGRVTLTFDPGDTGEGWVLRTASFEFRPVQR
jgi:hypothetical protein